MSISERRQARASGSAEDRLRRELAAEVRGFDRGREQGYRVGYAASDADWIASLEPARESARRTSRTLPANQFELVRWALRGEPRTRHTFSRSHPSDYAGGAVSWEPAGTDAA